MNLISFNFTKIQGSNKTIVKTSSIDTNIQFLKIEKEELKILKDSEVIKITFKFSVKYTSENKDKIPDEDQNNITFEGIILLSTEKSKAEEAIKDWQENNMKPAFRESPFNLILSKCSIKALSLEEDLGLPNHIPLPKIQNLKPKEDKKK